MIISKLCYKKLNIWKIVFVAFVLSLEGIRTQENQICTQFCQVCSQNSTACEACSDGFELSQSSECINSSIIDNCMLFGPTNTCKLCKPSYRLFPNNTCIKMVDGCLISDGNGTCKKCIQETTIPQFGTCDATYLNCLKISSFSQCIQCQIGYTLTNGKCVTNDSNCQQLQPTTGLCVSCIKGYSLVGYQCVQPANSSKCYLLSPDKKSCINCKNGYKSYFGKCLTPTKIQFIIMELTNTSGKCQKSQYFNLKYKQCCNIPPYCDKFDYGFMKCAFCHSRYSLIEGICRDPSLKHCVIFSQINPLSCYQCQSRFYLDNDNSNSNNNTLCKQYPLFCTTVSQQKCISCAYSFILNSKGYCQDPNCESFNSQTYECLTCRPSYIKNLSNICTFTDPNCLSVGSDNTCTTCKPNYKYSSQKNICRYRESNCKIFSDKGKCIQCNSKYYLNKSMNHCQELPFKCLSMNSDGLCLHCQLGFYLLPNKQCMPYTITNCDIHSQQNNTICLKCKQNYYIDINGICTLLPPFCEQFDNNQYLCSRCNKNSIIKNGRCYDNNCQYFGENSECLGCKKGFEYNKKGQCVIIQSDRNCKQYINGQCRVCSDRYYFDKQWKCTNVSVLCRNYDPNNGDCISCYSGYILNQGLCINQSQQISCDQYSDTNQTTCQKCHEGYKLNDKQGKCYLGYKGCAMRSPTNRTCLKCEENYLLDKGSGFCLKLSKKIQKNKNKQGQSQANFGDVDNENHGYSDQNCTILANDGSSCIKCINKMYYDQNKKKCTAVPPNCKNFNQSSGICLQCQEGYNLTQNVMDCLIDNTKNANCKIFKNNTNECLQCYDSFYYSNEYKKCIKIVQFCKIYDRTSGNCLSCENGYIFNGKSCTIQHNNQSNNTIINLANNTT